MDIYKKYRKQAIMTLIAAMIINIGVGIQHLWSLSGRAMMVEYGFTAAQAALPYTFMSTTAALWSLVSGRIADFLKPKYGAMLAAVLMGTGFFVASYSKSLAVICIFAGMFFGMASPSASACTTSTAMKWFPLKRKGLVAGSCNCFVAMTSLVFAPLLNKLLENYGVQTSFRIMGIVAFVFITVMAQFLLTPPKEIIDHTAEESAELEKLRPEKGIWYPNMLPKDAIKKPITLKLWLIYGCAFFGGQFMISQATNIIMSETAFENKALIVMGIALGQMVGRFASPTLSDKFTTSKVFKVLFAVQCLNMLGFFSIYKTAALMIMGAVIVGFCHGSTIPTTWAIVTDVFGKKAMGSICGMVITVQAITGIISPQSAARIFDATGSYHWAFFMCACVSALGFIVACTLKRPKDAIPTEPVAN